MKKYKKNFKVVDRSVKKLMDILEDYLPSDKKIDFIIGMNLYEFINTTKEIYGWIIPYKATIDYLRIQSNSIKTSLIQGALLLEKENPILERIFTNLLFKAINELPEDVIFDVILEMNNQNFRIQEVASYQANNLITKKTKIDYKTSESIKQLLVKILNPNKGTILDCFLGTGGNLIEVNKYLKKNQIETKNILLYGQEINEEVYYYAKFNFIMNGMINNTQLKLGDSIINPLINEKGQLQKYDYIISSPPIKMLKWGFEDIKNDKYRRFIYGMPGKISFDWAALQHVIATLNNKGRAALLVTESTLFRSSEASIRGKVIQDDLIDTVISLPSKMLQFTSIPVYLIIINKDKPEERRGKVQFIDATQEFEKGRKINTLTQKTINKIINIYKDGKNLERISYHLEINQLRKYNWDLNAFKYLELDQFKRKLDNMIKLKEVTYKIRRGVQLSRSKLEELYQSSNKTHYLINLSDIREDGTILYSEETRIKPEEKWINLYEIQEGDLIISSRGTITKIAIVGQNYKPAIISGNLMIVRTNPNLYDVNVLEFYLQSHVGQKLLDGIKTGTIVSVISPNTFGDLLIPKINNITEISQAIRANEEEYSENMKEIKKIYLDNKNRLYKKMGIDFL